jgi:tRNA pseudouridine55 synthase
MAKNRRSAKRHGYVVIDKPGGMSSHDVVSRVRRILGERRVGHAGTLDPAAVGVLPIAVGFATRTVEYLASSHKSYLAEITFGIETDSADADGTLVGEIRPVTFSASDLVKAVTRFAGDSLQSPPMHSAVKVDGKHLYELARAGLTVDVTPRSITIHRIACVRWASPVATIEIDCSKGTYVRSIARDLGRILGPGAYLSNLVRTRTGPFTLADAMTLDLLTDQLNRRPWAELAFHPDTVLLDLPAAVVGSERALEWRQGKMLQVSRTSGVVRVYDTHGRWLGVGTAVEDGRHVQPEKVIIPE